MAVNRHSLDTIYSLMSDISDDPNEYLDNSLISPTSPVPISTPFTEILVSFDSNSHISSLSLPLDRIDCVSPLTIRSALPLSAPLLESLLCAGLPPQGEGAAGPPLTAYRLQVCSSLLRHSNTNEALSLGNAETNVMLSRLRKKRK